MASFFFDKIGILLREAKTSGPFAHICRMSDGAAICRFGYGTPTASRSKAAPISTPATEKKSDLIFANWKL